MQTWLSRLTDSPWAISREHVAGYLPLVAALMLGKGIDAAGDQDFAALRAAARPVDYVGAAVAGRPALTFSVRSGTASAGPQPEKGTVVRVLSVKGPLMKADQSCGPRGLMSLAADIQEAGQDAGVDAILLRVDSPGGQVYGTQSVVDAINQVGKPVVALCEDGLMCSAAYWLSSAADTILATHETCTIGSIGVMAAWQDVQPALEKLGVAFHEVYAEQSSEKNADFRAAAAGDYAQVQQRLTAIADVFLGQVVTSRGLDEKAATKSGVLKGKTFSASEALSQGLIDSLGSFQDALQECARLVQAQRAGSPGAGASRASSLPPTSSMSLFAKKLTLGAATLALVGAETVTPEQATAANAELQAAGITGAQLITEAAFSDLETKAGRVAELETAASAVTTALKAAGATDVAGLAAARDKATTDLASANTELERLRKLPGASHSNPTLEAGKTDVDAPEPDADQQALNNLAHNKALAGHPVFGGK